MKFLVSFLLTFFISFSALGFNLSLKEVEGRMVQGGYLDTLYAAYWAAGQGEAIVPILEEMLYLPKKYQKEPFTGASAYPFNVIWALAHIDSNRSLKILMKFSKWTTTKLDKEVTGLAIKGFQLRRTKQSKVARACYGVLVRAAAKLLERPSGSAPVLKLLKSGQSVRVLKPYLENQKEEGPRSGPAIFDYIELIPEGGRGYIQRLGGDFTSFI
ncbi:MAG TPA: hypothetical protein VHY08_19385 [Bacillota bacterium]|nr:hypothetical protein [Bacillota bacterium]